MKQSSCGKGRQEKTATLKEQVTRSKARKVRKSEERDARLGKIHE